MQGAFVPRFTQDQDTRKARQTGTNPIQQRKAEQAERAVSSATTDEAAAREFHGTKAGEWSEGHATKWLRMNELYLFPVIGSLSLESIKAKTLLMALRKVEAKGIADMGRQSRPAPRWRPGAPVQGCLTAWPKLAALQVDTRPPHTVFTGSRLNRLHLGKPARHST